MNLKNTFLLIACGTGLCLQASAQTVTLSGKWKLNLTKSFMATEHPSSDYQLTRVIEQKDAHVVITDSAVHKQVLNIPVPDATAKLDLVADGKEHEIQVPGFLPFLPPVNEYITAAWQGGTLDVRERKIDGADYSERRFFLSEEGSELIVLIKSRNTYSEVEQRMVFDRQQ